MSVHLLLYCPSVCLIIYQCAYQFTYIAHPQIHLSTFVSVYCLNWHINCNFHFNHAFFWIFILNFWILWYNLQFYVMTILCFCPMSSFECFSSWWYLTTVTGSHLLLLLTISLHWLWYAHGFSSNLIQAVENWLPTVSQKHLAVRC